MQNGEGEESDVDSMMNDKWHRIAITDLNEVSLSQLGTFHTVS